VRVESQGYGRRGFVAISAAGAGIECATVGRRHRWPEQIRDKFSPLSVRQTPCIRVPFECFYEVGRFLLEHIQIYFPLRKSLHIAYVHSLRCNTAKPPII